MSEPYELNKEQVRAIKRKVREDLACLSRQEAATLYRTYLVLLSQREFCEGIAATPSGSLLLLLLNGIRIFNWITIACSVGFVALAFAKGPMMLWGVALFIAQWLVLNKIQTEINLDLIARGMHFTRYQAEQFAGEMQAGERAQSPRQTQSYVCSVCKHPLPEHSVVCPNCGVGIGLAR